MKTKGYDMKGKLCFVVVGVRHFMNGEHHWFAPEHGEGFAEHGEVRTNGYYKPVFTSMKDAENYAMAFNRDECTLAEFEYRRPTMHIVEEQAFVAIVERDSYDLPSGAEAWSDAKTADYERECDCEDIENQSLWDSDSDEERVSEKTLSLVHRIAAIDGLDAWLDHEGASDHIVVEARGENKEAVADYIESRVGFPMSEVEWSHSDESANIAWYRVK